MNRLSSATAEMFEEHLLVCPSCATAVLFADEFVPLLREAGNGYYLAPYDVALLDMAS